MLKRFFAAVFILGSSGFAYAGWTGGGGGFVRDANNPWFLKNTPVVNYCVKIDEKNFGLAQKTAEEMIEQALRYWKKEYEISRSLTNVVPDELGIATQKFVLSSCSDQTALTFLLGVLPDTQDEPDWKPTSFIGVTIRTDYDRVNMRGKGFIYISPGNGPLKYKNKDTVDNAWALLDGNVFRAVIMHELGHVFGLSHVTGGYGLELMHQSFPESLLRRQIWDDPNRSKEMDHYFMTFNPAIFKFRGVYKTVDGKIKREVFGRGSLVSGFEIGGIKDDKVFLRVF